MNITFFGHNCFFIRGRNVNLLSDPWLSKKGAFFGSWFQWPINHKCEKQFIDTLIKNKNTYLYISHEHQDHFDKETLKLIKPYIKLCIIPKYNDSFLYNEICSLGYEVLELADQSKHYFNVNDYIELMIIDTGVNHDSTAIFKIDKKVFVNQNDCKIFDRLNYLENINVDYYSVQFSGANLHPVCYEMEEVERKKISNKKVLSKLIAVRNAIKLIKPRFYLPSAGPAIFPFLKTDLSLGVDNIFVHQPDIKKFLKNSDTEVLCLKPGECLDPLKHKEPIAPPSLLELENLKKNLTCEFSKHKDEDFDVEELIIEVKKRLGEIKDLIFAQCPELILDWGKEGLSIDLNKKVTKKINFVKYKLPSNFMRLQASPAYFSLMANPKYRWQDIFLTLRVNVKRMPDIFNTFINIFLFSDVSNIRSGFVTTLSINDERIVVVNPYNGKNYEVNRFCPHNGADLKNARIDNDGNIVCPRHSWQFNLNNKGRCINANATIDAKEIVDTITLCETISSRLTKNDL